MLSIMSLALRGSGGNELVKQQGSSEERRKQIFGLYVEQMFQRKGMTSPKFPKEKIIDWVSWLARKMSERSQSVFLVEGLQPSWLDTKAQRVAYGTVVVLGFGLTFGPISGLIFGMIGGLSKVLMWGLIGGLVGWLGVGSLNHITYGETISWNWHQFCRKAILGSIFGMIFGLIFGSIFGSIFGPMRGLMLSLWLTLSLRLMLIVALINWVIFALMRWLVRALSSDLVRAYPNKGIKLLGKGFFVAFLNTLVATELIGGLVGCLIAIGGQIKEGLYFGLIAGTIIGLILGLFFGLVSGLNRGGSAVIKHYALRLILWWCGNTPFTFIKVLDHCASLILLKKVGGGYIFIHRMLLDYFAELPAQPPRAEDGIARTNEIVA